MAGPHTSDALALAELLARRLCHELAGPAGALAGTLEMAIEDRDLDTVALAHEQATLLVTRLRLLRAAWGDGEAMHAGELQALLAGLPRAAKVRTELDGLDPGVRFAAPAARVLLNALLLAGESLPRGGRVTLTSAGAGATVSLHGKDAAWPPELADLLAEEVAWRGVDARHLQAPLTVSLARAAGVALSLAPGGAGDTFSLLVAP